MATNVAYDGAVHVQREMCATCIFRPGNQMHLNEGRVEQMVSEAIDEQGTIPCHETLDHKNGAICRGFWNKHRRHVGLLQVAERLGFVREVQISDG